MRAVKHVLSQRNRVDVRRAVPVSRRAAR
jgi:hypothetical protein